MAKDVASARFAYRTANVDDIASVQTMSPLIPTSFIIGKIIHTIAVVGIMQKSAFESPTAVAAQDPVMDVNQRIVTNASMMLPVTHTRPGAEAKYALAQSRSVKECNMLTVYRTETRVTVQQWPCATALCKYIRAKSGLSSVLSVMSVITGCFDENATTIWRARFITQEHKMTKIAQMSNATGEVPPIVCMSDIVPTPNKESKTDSIAHTKTPPVARMMITRVYTMCV